MRLGKGQVMNLQFFGYFYMKDAQMKNGTTFNSMFIRLNVRALHLMDNSEKVLDRKIQSNTFYTITMR